MKRIFVINTTITPVLFNNEVMKVNNVIEIKIRKLFFMGHTYCIIKHCCVALLYCWYITEHG